MIIFTRFVEASPNFSIEEVERPCQYIASYTDVGLLRVGAGYLRVLYRFVVIIPSFLGRILARFHVLADSALGIIWKHAYEEGYQNGRLALLQNLEKKLDEKYKQGEKEGIKKGKEKYYGKGIVEGESEEYKRWTKAGHNDRCFKSTMIRDDASTQTDAPATATSSVSTQTTFPTTSQARSFVENGVDARLALTAAVSIQTDAIIVTAPFSTSTATQTDSINTISPATTDFFVQTDPISTRESHYVIKHPTSPTLLPATSTSSTTTTGTKTDTTTSQPLTSGKRPNNFGYFDFENVNFGNFDFENRNFG